MYSFGRNHEFDMPITSKRKSARRKAGDVQAPYFPSRGCRPVRQHHHRDESKILPHIRAGISLDL